MLIVTPICLLTFSSMVMVEETPHRLTLFGGLTQAEEDSSENGATIAFAYTYRIHHPASAGGLLEYAGGDIDAWLVGLPFKVTPWAGWFLLIAPGVEIESSETSAMFRIGTGYDFELDEKWSLAPEFYVDLSRFFGTTYVFGLAVSRSF